MNETSVSLAADYISSGKWEDVKRLLHHIDEEIREAGAYALAGCAEQKGIDISPALDALAGRFSDDEDVKKWAAYAIAWHHINRAEPGKAGGMLAEKDSTVRLAAASALGNAAGRNKDVSGAAQALEKAVLDPEEGVAYGSVRALLSHYAASGRASDAQTLLQHANGKVQETARSLLGPMVLQTAKAGNVAGLMQALSLGADVESPSDDGKTPLILAATAGQTGAVEALLEKGARVDATDEAGRTALMHAAYQGHQGTAEALLARGAGLNLRSGAEFTALDYACRGGELDLARLLVGKGAALGDSRNVLTHVCNEGYTEIAKLVISLKPDVNAKDGNGLTGLMYAAVKGFTEIVEALLDAGADPNIVTAEGAPGLQKGLTALYFAACNSHKGIEEMLEKRGAKVTEQVALTRKVKEIRDTPKESGAVTPKAKKKKKGGSST